jgi:hypothetical protein
MKILFLMATIFLTTRSTLSQETIFANPFTRNLYNPKLLTSKIVKPIVKRPIGTRLAAIAPEKYGPDTKVTIGLYDAQGNINGSKVLTGKEIEDGLNTFTQNETKSFGRLNSSLTPSRVLNLNKLNIKTKVKRTTKFDRELNQNIEVIEIPQDPKISSNLVAQKSKLLAIPLKPAVRPIANRPILARPITPRPVISNPSRASGPSHPASPHSANASYDKSWGSKSRFSAYLDAAASNYGSRTRRTAKGHFKAGGYVFNKNIALIYFSAKSERKNNSNSGRSFLKILGQTKWETSSSTPKKTLKFTREKSRRQRFWIGPLPVSVGGAIGGSVGASMHLYAPNPKSIEGSITPYIDSYGAIDAAIDVWLARAGVEGALRIIKDSVPVVTTLKYNPAKQDLKFKLKVKNELKALDGKVSIYAKVRKLFGGWRKWSKTLLSWTGFSKSWTLIDKNLVVKI